LLNAFLACFGGRGPSVANVFSFFEGDLFPPAFFDADFLEAGFLSEVFLAAFFPDFFDLAIAIISLLP
jgi:hypothetical protein